MAEPSKIYDYREVHEQFLWFMTQARELPLEDLARHARVSIRNRCECGQCFCCACKVVMMNNYERERWAKVNGKY